MASEAETRREIFKWLVIIGTIIVIAQILLPYFFMAGIVCLIVSIIVFIIEHYFSYGNHQYSPWIFGASIVCFAIASLLWIIAVPFAQSPIGQASLVAKNASDSMQQAENTLKDTTKQVLIDSNRNLNGGNSTQSEKGINDSFNAINTAEQIQDAADTANTIGKVISPK